MVLYFQYRFECLHPKYNVFDSFIDFFFRSTMITFTSIDHHIEPIKSIGFRKLGLIIFHTFSFFRRTQIIWVFKTLFFKIFLKSWIWKLFFSFTEHHIKRFFTNKIKLPFCKIHFHWYLNELNIKKFLKFVWAYKLFLRWRSVHCCK